MKIVTGTGRSGTSLACQLLHAAGADFGPAERLQPADDSNPRGYFEQQEVNAINIRLLLGRRARPELQLRPPRSLRERMIVAHQRALYSRHVSPATLEQRAAAHDDRIKALCAEYRNRFVKDPRFSRTLAAWLPRCDIECVIFCFRDPIQVADSMKKAYGAPRPIALREWRMRVHAFLEQAGEVPVRLIDCNRLLDTADESHAEVRALLALVSCEPENASAIADRILDPSLFHARETDHGRLDRGTRDLWRRLRALHASSQSVSETG